MKPSAAALVLNSLRGLALAVACLAGPAQAAVYTGVWDPTFGNPFTNLGWRGQAQYDVPGSCEPSGSGDISNAVDCGGLASISSAMVELYDVTASGQPTLATLVFNPASMTVNTLRYVDGVLTQLSSGASALVDPTEDLSAFNVDASVSFFLQFSLTDGPRLGWTSCGSEFNDCQRGFNDGVNNPPRFSINRVPVPGTLPLAGLALLALGAAARRRAAV
jgi:hypothetical protein